MKLNQLIRNDYTVVDPYQGTASVKEKLLNNSFLVVMRDAVYKGILTPKDTVKSPYNLVVDCLSGKPHIDPDLGIDDVFRIMKETQNSVLPVFQKDKFMGVICRSDIMGYLIEEQWKLEVEVDLKQEALHHLNKKLINEIKDREIAERDVLELQKQVYHSQKMQALGTLASGVAHEFNNFLTIILGKAELTVNTLPKESTGRKNIEDIITTALQLGDILKQLLSFSYKTKPSNQSIDPVLMVEESIKLIKNALPKNIDIRFMPPGTPLQIEVDPSQLQQVLINLCMNAAHAMDNSQGFIEIGINETNPESLQKVYPDVQPGDYVEISVADTGKGIPQEIMEQIFDPFFTTKETGKGLGMGLAVVQKIIDSHGGKISVQSSPESGTTFRFILPKLNQTALVNQSTKHNN